MGYRVFNGKLHPIGKFDFNEPKNSNINKGDKKENFSDILRNQISKDESFTISKHASERLEKRNISLDSEDLKKINTAVNNAAQKGCKESLILCKNVGLITNIRNRTVITAVEKNEQKETIITNIDSVIII